MKTILFLPDEINLNDECFLGGFIETYDTYERIFITDTVLQDSEKAIGFCGPQIGKHNDLDVFINSKTKNIEIRGNKLNLLIVNYDLKSLKISQLFNNHGQFMELLQKIKCNRNSENNGIFNIFSLMFLTFLLKIIKMSYGLFKHSAFFIQLENSITSLLFLFSANTQLKQASLQKKSLIVCKIFDIILGIIVLYYIYCNEEYIIFHLQKTTEFIINGLKDVLNVLMDSPAGLKLNYALTKTLGIFFFYHISLWRAFIHIINPVLHHIFRIFFIPAFFGLSFQIAMLSDFIAFMTFHVYCIYVYAARLYGIQIYGLRSLWKLFIGRKWNPLRNRVDSFQYSHNQLFVGTLGFTVFLFLLPTIFLNYAVFTAFRLLLLLLNKTLDNAGKMLQILPLYVVMLWIFKSSKIKGALNIQLYQYTRKPNNKLHLKLNPLSLVQTIRLSIPSISEKNIEVTPFIQGLFTGSLF